MAGLPAIRICRRPCATARNVILLTAHARSCRIEVVRGGRACDTGRWHPTSRYHPCGAKTRPEPLRSMTMTTYSGPATLILADGARVAGTASLGTNHRGDLKGWSGTFRPNEARSDAGNARDGLQIELPYEQIGAVAVTSVRKVLATQVLMSLVGRGPAPF